MIWSSLAYFAKISTAGWLRFNVPPNTLYIILGMGNTGQKTQPTVSKHWRKRGSWELSFNLLSIYISSSSPSSADCLLHYSFSDEMQRQLAADEASRTTQPPYQHLPTRHIPLSIKNDDGRYLTWCLQNFRSFSSSVNVGCIRSKTANITLMCTHFALYWTNETLTVKNVITKKTLLCRCYSQDAL